MAMYPLLRRVASGLAVVSATSTGVTVAGATLTFSSEVAQAQTALPLPAPATISNSRLALRVGEVVRLPYTGVTRVIVDDSEVAQAAFVSGSVLLNGLMPGSTFVEIYQTDTAPIVFTVNVGNSLVAPPRPSLPSTLPPPALPSPSRPAASRPATPTTPSVKLPAPSTTAPAAPRSVNAPASSAPSAPILESPDTPVVPLGAPISPAEPPRLSVEVAATPLGAGAARFDITYSNPGLTPAENVVVRFPLAEGVSYVPDSASNGGRYDAVQREVVWNLGTVAAGPGDNRLSLRVEPIERGPLSFLATASVEATNGTRLVSAPVSYSTTPPPLLAAFALPDRFLAGRSGAPLRDVRDEESRGAIARLAQLGVVYGRGGGRFEPNRATRRAEFAVMTLNGLSLRDLRETTQIKLVLARKSTASVEVKNASGQTVAVLMRNQALEAGENAILWDGRRGDLTAASGATPSFLPPGRYSYAATVRDESGQTNTLGGTVTVVAPTLIKAEGVPSFSDVKASDWYAGHLAVGEREGLLKGYTDNTFRPSQPISRAEATAIAVRAVGLESQAQQWANKDVGFVDGEAVPDWARGYINVASTVARTNDGRPLLQGTKDNSVLPQEPLRRENAALIVNRVINREMTRVVSVSGALAPGAVVSINSQAVTPDPQGQFTLTFPLNTTTPTTVAVLTTGR